MFQFETRPAKLQLRTNFSITKNAKAIMDYETRISKLEAAQNLDHKFEELREHIDQSIAELRQHTLNRHAPVSAGACCFA